MADIYRQRKNIGKVAGISEEELAIFGVTDVESRILLALLELGPMRVNKLAREGDMPHTTAHSALRRLRDQGLVRRVSKGYFSVWRAVQAPKIREKMEKALKPFEFGISRKQLELETGAKILERSDFFIFEGVGDILKGLQWFYINHRGEEIFKIEGAHCHDLMREKLKDHQNMALNQCIFDNNVLICLRRGEDLGALSEADVTIAKDMALITNWHDERLTITKNPDLLSFLSILASP